MRLLLKLGTGTVARFLGMLAEHFAQWLFHELETPATPLPPALLLDTNPELTGAAN